MAADTASGPGAKGLRSALWEFLQGLGKTFMLPVALLAFCGILLGIGSSLSSGAVTDSVGFLKHEPFQTFFLALAQIGKVAFTFLPALFAMAIPLGLAREDKGVAAFSGFVGYASMLLGANFVLQRRGALESTDTKEDYDVTPVLGIESIDTGILGAVIAGIVVWRLHERFHRSKMPDALAFFGGTRSVPIISAVVLSAVGLAVPLLWPPLADGIASVGRGIASTGPFGPFLFGMGEALLRPIGLHHILVALFRFTDAGGSGMVCGEEVRGALNLFYAQLDCDQPSKAAADATDFLSQGKMATYLGGLPGAALAMYHCARPENRGKIKALLISGVVACAVGGITEPLEFLFLFVAPFLYVIHAVLIGLGFLAAALLGVHIGNTDGNLIDFFVFGILQGTATRWYVIPVLAAIWFVVYYVIFRFFITRFHLKTPGRDPGPAEDAGEVVTEHDHTHPTGEVHGAAGQPAGTATAVGLKGAPAILAALGGGANITSLDNCITRLRLSVEDMSLVDDDVLKANGAVGVMKLDDHNLQVIIGPQVQSVKDEIDGLMADGN
ncbi:PTS maltose transporter subunit IICB [Streptomyces sp. A7024]|uniref:PTS maltose transporter subunit IICB n=1 Tax=Streptomyces coryli TaxID=1128680 RepID=A0A6G4U3M2_9ACTN|nr:maltose/glucose-specific PTS transporter subunit IIBC [Streptomyces coryli]NGN66764.1 PTS maltose transporter subunit IICB [Streptomyces coryli]